MRGLGLPDDLVVRPILERNAAEVVRVRKTPFDGRLRKDLAVRERPSGDAVGDAAVGGDRILDVRPEERCPRFDECDATRGTGARQAVELGGDAAAVHGVGEAVHREVLGTPFRVVDRDVLPVHLEFVRDDLGKCSADVLTHLGFHDVNAGVPVRHHREPDGRRESLRRFGGGVSTRDHAVREADAERQPRSGCHRPDHEVPP